jgi:hypothetical protein
MTPARQERKQNPVWFSALACLTLVLGAAALVSRATATEQIVVDWHTGLAIGGYDPVAYFTDGMPTAGSADLEFSYGGAVWRFSNVGNRAAFVEQPDVYMPRFGGYDPLGVAGGVAVAGKPSIWFIAGERLFLFFDRARRDRFAADPDRATAAAERKWPEVRHTLSP